MTDGFLNSKIKKGILVNHLETVSTISSPFRNLLRRNYREQIWLAK